METHRLFKSFLHLAFLVLFFSPCVSKAQTIDTLASSYYRPKVASFIIPAIFIGYGLISIGGNNPIRSLDLTTKNELQEDHPQFAAHADNYLQFSPAAIVFGLNLAGIKGKHHIGDAAGIYLMSITIMTGSVTALKRITKRERPDHSTFNSFPSGHTATAFASAEFLKQEYGDRYPWMTYAGFAVATGTGALRMYNNRHWLSDVVAGAGFGIISTKLSYLLYPEVKKLLFGKKASTLSFMPTYQNGSAGFYLGGNF
ncbi:phosphatase PAP2 family protein [Pedobacter sp. N36a]|uniref:phosphatase PAP2 family protein n=1 Tax=Pedobacter sp. N36a TaxID=2767996 RepID=UPI001657214D|nr:phosphatase PAP2 family protein [Pedobacter sp. N36a]MBC8984901.1 phosphatase PAP2 family protein [Pedobacter sp. N36a]